MRYRPADVLDREVPMRAPQHSPADVLARPRRWGRTRWALVLLVVGDLAFLTHVARIAAGAGGA